MYEPDDPALDDASPLLERQVAPVALAPSFAGAGAVQPAKAMTLWNVCKGTSLVTQSGRYVKYTCQLLL